MVATIWKFRRLPKRPRCDGGYSLAYGFIVVVVVVVGGGATV